MLINFVDWSIYQVWFLTSFLQKISKSHKCASFVYLFSQSVDAYFQADFQQVNSYSKVQIKSPFSEELMQDAEAVYKWNADAVYITTQNPEEGLPRPPRLLIARLTRKYQQW